MVFNSLLEARGRMRRPSQPAADHRLATAQPSRGSRHPREARSPSASPEPLHSSDESGMILGAIPDRGMECGFGPPVLPGTYSSRTESEELSPQVSERAPAAQAPEVAEVDPQPLNRHGRLQILHDLFHEGASIPVGPEVLRFALDLVSSDTSLNAEGDEAVQLLAERLAEVRSLAEEDHEEEEEEEEDMDPEEGYDERSRPRPGRGRRAPARQATTDAGTTASPEPVTAPRRPESAYSM